MYFNYFAIISTLWKVCLFIWTDWNPLHPRMLCDRFDWSWTSGSGEEDFLIFQCIFTFSQLSPLWEGDWSFIWTNFIPLQPRIVCAKFGWNWTRCSGEDFEKLTIYLYYFPIIFPFRRAWPFIWTNFLEKKIFKCCHFTCIISQLFLFGKGVGLHLNKFESPSPRNNLCHVLLRLAQWLWRRNWKWLKHLTKHKFSKKTQAIIGSPILYYSVEL